MFLGEPQTTSYDLRFSLGGFAVRIHPFFWILALVFAGGDHPKPLDLMIGIPVILISILVHELGHAVAMRYYGQQARIVLYAFGGLAIPESDVFNFVSQRTRRPIEQIVISAAGPAAGFSLAVLAAALILAAGGEVKVGIIENFPYVLGITNNTIFDNEAATSLLNLTLFINVWWTVLNLMPVYPLDGGQIAREFFVLQDPGKGLQNSLYVSLGIAVLLALWGLTSRQLFLGIMFASLAYSNWEVLQQVSGRGGFRGGRGGGW